MIRKNQRNTGDYLRLIVNPNRSCRKLSTSLLTMVNF
jgi:hypothetical protein